MTSEKKLQRTQADFASGVLLITAGNCELRTGWSWRFVYTLAGKLGVRVLGKDRHRAIRADTFLAALEREAMIEHPPKPLEELNDEQQREQMIKQLGLKRVRS